MEGSSPTPGRIDRYWAGFFGLAPEEFLRPGVRVVAHAELGAYHGAWIYRRGTTALISVPPDLVAATEGRAAALPIEALQGEEGARALFGDAVERVIGPAFQGTLAPEAFRPVASPYVRRLTPGDRSAIEQLRAACDPVEWEHSNLTPERPEAFGYFDGALLVAASHNVPRAPDAADHGVITHPGYRGRGCGKAVVSASVQYALERDRLILYQTLVANTAAVGIALAIGMREYARHVAVRLR
jgi:ribosomal protein S18 acetylase RimI-like enzyme